MNILGVTKEKGVVLVAYFGYDATFQVAFIFILGWRAS